MESKIGAILGNPEMMQQIMAMAQQFQSPPEASTPPSPEGQEMDFSMLQKLAPLLGKTRIDGNQQALLTALGPYLSPQRIAKLQKAMRAAKLAGMASLVLGSLQAGDDHV